MTSLQLTNDRGTSIYIFFNAVLFLLFPSYPQVHLSHVSDTHQPNRRYAGDLTVCESHRGCTHCVAEALLPALVFNAKQLNTSQIFLFSLLKSIFNPLRLMYIIQYSSILLFATILCSSYKEPSPYMGHGVSDTLLYSFLAESFRMVMHSQVYTIHQCTTGKHTELLTVRYEIQ